jgi:hypothetical protein
MQLPVYKDICTGFATEYGSPAEVKGKIMQTISVEKC